MGRAGVAREDETRVEALSVDNFGSVVCLCVFCLLVLLLVFWL